MVCDDESGGSGLYPFDNGRSKRFVLRETNNNLAYADRSRYLSCFPPCYLSCSDDGFCLCQLKKLPESDCGECGDPHYDTGQHLGVPADAIINGVQDCEFRFGVNAWHGDSPGHGV